MRKMLHLVILSLVLVFVLLRPCYSVQAAIDEQFDTLQNWVPVIFPKIERHTEYEIRKDEGSHVLVARSNDSASGLRYVKEFDVYEYPVLRWRWKVGNIYAKGDIKQKSGDDYPLRVYINFKYDPDKAGIGDRIIYGLAKAVYDEYPPHSSLSYIWANKTHEQVIYPSPYTDKAKLIIVRTGPAQTGLWLEEEVNILADYRQAFGDSPPATASIAIMNDSDNTGESSVSYLDYIQVLKKSE